MECWYLLKPLVVTFAVTTFHAGNQSSLSKMAASKSDSKTMMAEELVQLFKRINYDETVCALKQEYAVPIENFPNMEISNWLDLDMSKCFTEKKKLKFNPLCIYDIFASYCSKDKFEVKEFMRKEIVEWWSWFN